MKSLRNIGLVVLAIGIAAAIVGCNDSGGEKVANPDSGTGVGARAPEGKEAAGGAPATPSTE